MGNLISRRHRIERNVFFFLITLSILAFGGLLWIAWFTSGPLHAGNTRPDRCGGKLAFLKQRQQAEDFPWLMSHRQR